MVRRKAVAEVVEVEVVKNGRAAMSDEHKEALAQGRNEGRIVNRYLTALEQHRPRRGRKRTPVSIETRLAVIEEELLGADPLTRLHLVQERMNLQAELERMGETVDLSEFEEEFAEVAASYSVRKGINYDTWRAMGVAPKVLKKAGVGR